nr:ATP-grasp domain-containing protein [Paenibacillus turicensis]
MGFEAHVFAWQTGDIGETLADVFYPISIGDKEEILRECKRIKPCGVASITSDYAVQTVNFLQRSLGLRSNEEKVDLVVRNKYLMRLALEANKIKNPWFMRVDSNFDTNFNNAEVIRKKLPLIIKPTDRWSSKGVTRVDVMESFNAALNRAIKESLEEKAIVEEYIEGPEYSCECISYAGIHYFLAFTKKYTTGSPFYIETGHMQPSDIPNVIQKKVVLEVFKALDALNIEYGASHTEFKLLSNGEIRIVEIGARMAGDCIGTDLVQISTGYDYVKMVLDVSMGNEPCFKKNTAPKIAIIKYLVDQKDFEIFAEIKAKYRHYIWRSSMTNEHFRLIKNYDSTSRLGFFILAIDLNDLAAQKFLFGILK